MAAARSFRRSPTRRALLPCAAIVCTFAVLSVSSQMPPAAAGAGSASTRVADAASMTPVDTRSTVAARALLGAPKTRTPDGYVTAVRPVFKWTRARGATAYDVAICRAFTVKLVIRKTGVTRLSWRCTRALPKNTDLIWRVRARKGRRVGRWGTFGSFRIVNVADPSAPQVGQLYQGGIVAYILKSGDPGHVVGQTHGLIVSKADEPTALPWSTVTGVTVGTATAIGTGAANTAAIVAQAGCTGGAAWSCYHKTASGYSDWYLPSSGELLAINENKSKIGGVGFKDGLWNYPYWSSSEFWYSPAEWALYRHYSEYGSRKSTRAQVRAIRSF